MKKLFDDDVRPSIEEMRRTARRVTPEEHKRWSKALDAQLGPDRPRMGRPRLGMNKKVPIALRMDRDVLSRLRAKAAKIGIGYQTLINQWVGERL